MNLTIASTNGLQVCGSNGQALGEGESGELRVKSVGMFSEYLGRPQDTAKEFDEQVVGWCRCFGQSLHSRGSPARLHMRSGLV